MTDQSAVEAVVAGLRAKLPHEVENVFVRTGSDADGEPAIWAWVVIRNSAPPSAWSRKTRTQIRDQIISAFQQAGIPLWVYVRFVAADDVSTVPVVGAIKA